MRTGAHVGGASGHIMQCNAAEVRWATGDRQGELALRIAFRSIGEAHVCPGAKCCDTSRQCTVDTLFCHAHLVQNFMPCSFESPIAASCYSLRVCALHLILRCAQHVPKILALCACLLACLSSFLPACPACGPWLARHADTCSGFIEELE